MLLKPVALSYDMKLLYSDIQWSENDHKCITYLQNLS